MARTIAGIVIGRPVDEILDIGADRTNEPDRCESGCCF
jgi:hypothetical protein